MDEDLGVKDKTPPEAEMLAMESSSLVHSPRLFVWVEYWEKSSMARGALQAASTAEAPSPATR